MANPTDTLPPLALVTGGSRGIGRAITQRFLEEGWRVITCAREALTAEQRGHDRWLDHVSADLSVEADIARVADAALAAPGPIAALINNAGVSPKTPFKERLGILNGAIDLWYGVYALNFFAPLDLARRLAPRLHAARGSIINITSIAGHAVHPFAGSAYATSKAALSALTREMAAELGPLGIRVNAVAPGEIKTDMISADYEKLIPRIPMAGMGLPEEVAGTVFQLCNSDFSYVTGTEIFVTGGQHLL